MPRHSEAPLHVIGPDRKRSLMVWFPEGRGTLLLSLLIAALVTWLFCAQQSAQWRWGLEATMRGQIQVEAAITYTVFGLCWVAAFWALDQLRQRRQPRAELYDDRIEFHGRWPERAIPKRAVPLAQLGHIGLNGDVEFEIAVGSTDQPCQATACIPLEPKSAEDQFEAFRDGLESLCPNGLYSIGDEDAVGASRTWTLAELFPDAGETQAITAECPDDSERLLRIETDDHSFRFDSRSGLVRPVAIAECLPHGDALLRVRAGSAAIPRGMVFGTVEQHLDQSLTLRLDEANTWQFRWSDRSVRDPQGQRVGRFHLEPDTTTLEFDAPVSEVVAILGALFLGNRHASLRIEECYHGGVLEAVAPTADRAASPHFSPAQRVSGFRRPPTPAGGRSSRNRAAHGRCRDKSSVRGAVWPRSESLGRLEYRARS